MIAILAWRNIWRNPIRSMVVIAAIALGIWAAMFMSGFATGMAQSYINNSIATRISHLQIHHPEYNKEEEVRYYLEEATALRTNLASSEGIAGVSFRTVANGMLASSKSSRGVKIRGVDPAEEQAVIGLSDDVTEGTYFVADKKNQLLIGKGLAKKLGVKIRSRVVLTFQDTNRDITSAAFRIIGIYESGNTPFDESHIFIQSKDLNRLLVNESTPDKLVHEVAILLSDADQLAPLQEKLQTEFAGLKIENYRDLAPDVQLYESMIGSLSLIYLTIIMLALIFGIINTMLMAVLERFRELGMLMAIGMNKVRVFFMIVLETILLSIVGAPLGVLLGALTVGYVSKYGLDLSAFSSTMQMYGMSEIVYFDLSPNVYWQIAISITLTAIIASIYPAFKAIRLRPVEAIRKI